MGFTETRSPLVVECRSGESSVLTLFALAVLAGWFSHRLNLTRDESVNLHSRRDYLLQ